MADNTENIGGVSITVEADLSDLQGQFDSAVGIATQAGQEITSALNVSSDTSGAEALVQSLHSVGDAAQEAGAQLAAVSSEPKTLADYYDALEASALGASESTTELASSVQESAGSLADASGNASQLGSSLEEIGSGAASASTSLNEVHTSNEELSAAISGLSERVSELGTSIQELGSHLSELHQHEEEAASGLAGLATGLTEFAEALVITEGLKEFVSEALETYGAVQKATISLTALTGSVSEATETIERLKEVAISNALNFQSLVAADQRMTAFGISTEKIPGLLQDAADAAAATGNEFERTSQAIIRLTASGMASARMLVQLGLTTSDLAAVMGVASTDVQKVFKAMDESERIEVINTALQKFAGVSAAVAQSIPGQWQNVRTQFEFVMEGIGEALAPVASDIMSFLSDTVIPAVREIVAAFNELPGPLKDSIVVIGGLTAVLAPLALAIKGVITTFEALSTLKAAVATISGALTTATVTETAAVTAETAATTADTVALEANAAAQEADAAATAARTVAAEGAAVATGAAAAASGAATAATVGATTATSAWAAATTLGATIATAASAAIGILTLGVAAVKIADEQATGATVSWKDALLSFIGVESEAEVRTRALAQSQNDLASDVRKATDAINAAGQKLRDADTSYRQVTSAANFTRDAHEALSVKLQGLNAALDAAKVRLQNVTDDYHAGKASADDLARAYDAVTAASEAVTAAHAKQSAEAKRLADYLKLLAENAHRFQLWLTEQHPLLLTVASATEVAATQSEAHSMAITLQVRRVQELGTALVKARADLQAHVGTMERVVQVESELAAEQSKLNSLIGQVPDLKIDAAPITQADAALGTLFTHLNEAPAFIPTLEQIDAEWEKTGRHVDRLARYNLPAAIQAYQDYIGKLQQVGAPLGQIYQAEDRLLQLEIDSAAQSGTDATAQIVRLTNIREKTDALRDASAGLGNVYVGLMKTFDDTFNELGDQLTSVAMGTQSLGTAMHNVVMKMTSDIVNTLVKFALGQLKDAIIGITSQAGGMGGAISGAVKALAGVGGKGGLGALAGGAGGAQMQAAVAQFHAAVIQFQGTATLLGTSATTFGTGVTGFSTAVTALGTTATAFGTATTALGTAVTGFGTGVTGFGTGVTGFGTGVTGFGTAVTGFGTGVAGFGTAVTGFGSSVLGQASTVAAFAGAVTAFSAAVASMAASDSGGLISGLLSIFMFKGGGEVGNVPILSYLHPKEMVLPADITAGLKTLIGSGNIGNLGTSGAIVNITNNSVLSQQAATPLEIPAPIVNVQSTPALNVQAPSAAPAVNVPAPGVNVAPSINLPAPSVSVNPSVNVPPIETPSVSLPAIPAPIVNVPPISLPSIAAPSVPPISLPEISSRVVTVPPIESPTVNVPPVSIPQIPAPSVAAPIVNVPPIAVPKLEASPAPNVNVSAPSVSVPAPIVNLLSISLPKQESPSIQVPNISVPEIQAPSVSLPPIQIPTFTPSLAVPEQPTPIIQAPNVTVPPISVPPASVIAQSVPDVNVQAPSAPGVNVSVPPISVPPIASPSVNVPPISVPKIESPTNPTPIINVPASPAPIVNTPDVHLPSIAAPSVNVPPISVPPGPFPSVNVAPSFAGFTSDLKNLISSITPNGLGVRGSLSTPHVNLSLPSVPTAPVMPMAPATSISTVRNNEAPMFQNCTFNGVTQDLVNDVMNRAIKATRRAGSRF